MQQNLDIQQTPISSITPSERLASLYLSDWTDEKKTYETMCAVRMRGIFDLHLQSPVIKKETKEKILATKIYN